MNRTPDHLAGNVKAWQEQAQWYVEPAEEAWASAEPFWGIWAIPDRVVNLLPMNLDGRRCIEIGCGAGYVSAWLARRGATVIGIDPTPNQLRTANRLLAKDPLDITFELGFGEHIEYPDASFDFAISEYGAALWADPYEWIPEASRVLKPGGQLIFLTNSPFVAMCAPDNEADGPVTDRLLRSYFDLYRTHWPDAPGQTEFHLTHSAWIDLFRSNSLTVERLVELQPEADAQTRYDWADIEWARNWPTEEAWVLRKEDR